MDTNLVDQPVESAELNSGNEANPSALPSVEMKPTLSLNADLPISRSPWVAHARLSGSENHKGWRIFAATGCPIGEVYPLNSDPSPAARANAALIAFAPKLHAALEKINALACYASEENTDYRETALLEIGATARVALELVSDQAASEQKG